MLTDDINRTIPGRRFVLSTLLLCAAGLAMADADDGIRTQEKLVQFDITPGRIAWTMQPNSLTWTLSVAGPNFYHRCILPGGAAAELLPVGAEGAMPDGYYTWDFRPLNAQAERSQAPPHPAQQLGSSQRWSAVRTGGFRVRGGLFVVPADETLERSRNDKRPANKQ